MIRNTDQHKEFELIKEMIKKNQYDSAILMLNNYLKTNPANKI